MFALTSFRSTCFLLLLALIAACGIRISFVAGCAEHEALAMAMAILQKANVQNLENLNSTDFSGNSTDLLLPSASEHQHSFARQSAPLPPPLVLNLFIGGACRNLPPPQLVPQRTPYVPRQFHGGRLGPLPQKIIKPTDEPGITIHSLVSVRPTFDLRSLTEQADASSCANLPTRRVTPSFLKWLQENGYGDYDFASNGCGSATGSSFGGRPEEDNQQTESANERRPVIFIHGATDSAVGSAVNDTSSTNATAQQQIKCGWSNSIRYFLDNGYKMSDLYALTWGNEKPPRGHHPVYVERISKFIQAVLNYTSAPKVDIVAHSMGVTLARGAIVGGINGQLPRLSSRVTNFIGIAGANHGVTWCTSAAMPFCDWENGFSLNSPYLRSINARDKTRIANNIYSIWSPQDEVLSSSTTANTCLVPGQKCDVSVADLNHSQLKDKTAGVQYSLLNTGKCV